MDAHNILMVGGKNAKQRKKTVDAVAASLMLEGYLTFKKRAEIAEKGSAGALPFSSFFPLLFIGISDYFLNLRIVSAMIV